MPALLVSEIHGDRYLSPETFPGIGIASDLYLSRMPAVIRYNPLKGIEDDRCSPVVLYGHQQALQREFLSS